MAVTRINTAKSARMALAYATNGRGHNGNKNRNLCVSCCGGIIEGEPYYEQFEVNHLKALYSTRNEVHRIIISYSLDEFDPQNEQDISKADELAQRFVREVYPDHLAVICTQADGKGGKLHQHIILSNINTRTHKALDHCRTFKGGLKDSFNDVARRSPDLIKLDVGRKRQPDEVSARERGIIQRADAGSGKLVAIHRDILKPIIREEMEAAISRQDFLERMAARGVTVEYRTSNPLERTDTRYGASRDYGDYILYKMDPSLIPDGVKAPKNLKSKSYKLGSTYGINELDRHIRENQHNLKFERISCDEDADINERNIPEIDIDTADYFEIKTENAPTETDDITQSFVGRKTDAVEPSQCDADTDEVSREDPPVANRSAYVHLLKIRDSMDQSYDEHEDEEEK